jgi:uncharacterized protein
VVVLSQEERVQALQLARRAVERAVVRNPVDDPSASFLGEPLPQVFDEKRGVFVTLKRFPSDELRGCIGYPLPILPLRIALARAARAAAVEDPRFRPVRPEELPRIVFEVSVLTVPVPIVTAKREEIPAAIQVGRDGLIVEGLGTSGLLLPQVAPEQMWTAEEFLAGTCEKAGLPPDAWRQPEVTVRRFEAEVFHERTPGGDLEGEPAPPVRRAAPPGRRS